MNRLKSSTMDKKYLSPFQPTVGEVYKSKNNKSNKHLFLIVRGRKGNL